MRLWHQSLIPCLDDKRLLGQHRECCALRGKGWQRKHSTVNYVFKHDPATLVAYHLLVMKEMSDRGYTPDPEWYSPSYRGTDLGHQHDWCDCKIIADALDDRVNKRPLKIYYPEHDDAYLIECLKNLESKGVDTAYTKIKLGVAIKYDD